jgi:hypothetical protein
LHTVTTAEHKLLEAHDHLDEWPRYLAADLTVIDMEDGSTVDLAAVPAPPGTPATT